MTAYLTRLYDAVREWPCSTCGAEEGTYCSTATGARKPDCHAARAYARLADLEAAGLPGNWGIDE